MSRNYRFAKHLLTTSVIAILFTIGCPNLRITFTIGVFEPKQQGQPKKPIASVNVKIVEQGGPYSSESNTDSLGQVTLDLPVDDSEKHDYQITASKRGYKTTVVTISGQIGFEVPEEIFLPLEDSN